MAKRREERSTAVDREAAATEALYTDLLQTLSAISGSLGAIALRLAPARQKLKTQGDQIRYLAALGLDRKAIAGILATTEATVGVRLSEKKASRRRRRKTSGKR